MVITNTLDHILSFETLVEEAIEYRSQISLESICRYGIPILDDYVGGILPSELVVIGAESGVGKSEIAYNIAITNAQRNKKVLLLSLEGDIQEIGLRFLQKEINRINAKNGEGVVKTAEYRFNNSPLQVQITEQVVLENMEEALKKNLFIFNKKEIPSMEFVRELILTMKDNVDLIIIDHLHYIHMDSDTETREIGRIMRELKIITDIIKKPIVLISHMRKRPNKEKDEDPTLNDLYGSSNISKEATTIILLRKRNKTNFELPLEIAEDNNYMGNKIILEKSRIGLGNSSFQLIYDRNRRVYVDEFCSLREYESGIKKDEKIVFTSKELL